MNKTKIFLIFILAAGGVYDTYAFLAGGTEATISNVVMAWTYEYPAFTFGLGYLMGHLTWRIRDIKRR